MVEQEAYCPDVMKQLAAVQGLVEATSRMVFRNRRDLRRQGDRRRSRDQRNSLRRRPADFHGTVHCRGGDKWQAVDELAGSPQVPIVHDGGVVAAVDDGSTVIYTSEDGKDWAEMYRGPAAP